MKKISAQTGVLLMVLVLASCNGSNNNSDAYGNFEAVEITVSSEGNGKIIEFNMEEGQAVQKGEKLGVIDTIQLYLKKMQLEATVRAIYTKLPDVAAQADVIKEQLANAETEKVRFEKLVKSDAATQKQLDDIIAQIKLLEKQLSATLASLNTQTKGTLSEIEPLRCQIKQIDDQIRRSVISSPIDGTVLTKFVESGELAAYGRALYKVADVDNIILRAYFSGEQLSQVQIGQSVTVLIDAPDGQYKTYPGTVTWVAQKAEFAPKVIQTKEERVNLVYAVKVLVKNDGAIKIGMPGELKL